MARDSIRASSITCSSVSTADARLARRHSAPAWGLSITRGLLAAAGGRVWAENVPGAGARFTIVVPGPVRAGAGDGVAMAARILIVDDEPNIIGDGGAAAASARLRGR